MEKSQMPANPRPLDPREQLAGLCIIGYLEGMMTESPREQFSKTENE